MRKFLIVSGIISLTALFVSCGAGGNDPGRAYMPDMYYSRAYETYGYNDVGGEFDTLKARGIYYNGMPVPGSRARGESVSYQFRGTTDSMRLAEGEALKSPLDTSTKDKVSLQEAQRLYLVNCGICHGPALDGNGPIVTNGAYPGVPKNLMAADAKAFSDGHYYTVITEGYKTMGSYKSQLTPEQRWWVIKYIRSKQGPATAAKAIADSSNTAPNQGVVVPKVTP